MGKHDEDYSRIMQRGKAERMTCGNDMEKEAQVAQQA